MKEFCRKLLVPVGITLAGLLFLGWILWGLSVFTDVNRWNFIDDQHNCVLHTTKNKVWPLVGHHNGPLHREIFCRKVIG